MLRSSLKGHLLLIIVIVVGMTLAAAVVIQHFTNHFALAVILSMVLNLVLGVILGSQFADSLIQRIQHLAAGVGRIQQGDLSQNVDLISLDEVRGLEEGLAGTVMSFRDLIGEMKQVSFQINRTDQKLSRLVKKVVTNSEGIDRLARGIARGSEKQALIVEQTALGLGRELNDMDSLVPGRPDRG